MNICCEMIYDVSLDLLLNSVKVVKVAKNCLNETALFLIVYRLPIQTIQNLLKNYTKPFINVILSFLNVDFFSKELNI